MQHIVLWNLVVYGFHSGHSKLFLSQKQLKQHANDRFWHTYVAKQACQFQLSTSKRIAGLIKYFSGIWPRSQAHAKAPAAGPPFDFVTSIFYWHWNLRRCACRLTVAFTPIVVQLSGGVVSKKEWGSAAVGVLGGLLISLDTALRSGSGDSTSPIGKMLDISFLCHFQSCHFNLHWCVSIFWSSSITWLVHLLGKKQQLKPWSCYPCIIALLTKKIDCSHLVVTLKK